MFNFPFRLVGVIVIQELVYLFLFVDGETGELPSVHPVHDPVVLRLVPKSFFSFPSLVRMHQHHIFLCDLSFASEPDGPDPSFFILLEKPETFESLRVDSSEMRFFPCKFLSSSLFVNGLSQ